VMVFFYYIFLECYVFKYGPMDSNTGLWEHRYTEPTGEALVVMFLLCKAAYFALSALQAMHGFPHQNSPSSHTKGNFLQRLPKDENSVECPPTALQYYTFMVYLFIPFLYELRTFLDWTCMPTTLVFYQWLKVEDISNELFQMQYIGWSRSPQKLHRRLGQPLSWQLKVGMGGFGFLALCLIIWAPLLLFAPSVLTTVQNPIRRFDADLSITVEHLPFRLYEGAQVRPCSCPKWPNGSVIAPDHLQQAFDTASYTHGGGVCQLVVMQPMSSAVWDLPAPRVKQLIHALNTTVPAEYFTIDMKMQRHSNKLSGYIPTLTRRISQNVGLQTSQILAEGIQEVYDMVDDGSPSSCNQDNDGQTFQRRLPYVGDYQSNIPFAFSLTEDSVDSAISNSYQHVALNLVRRCKAAVGWQIWWEIVSTDTHTVEKALNKNVQEAPFDRELGPCRPGTGLKFYIFSKDVLDGNDAFADFISGYGMTGLYTTFVLVVATALRTYFSGVARKIIWEDMDDVNELKAILYDLYAAREAGDLKSEEQVYRYLISIYRSPETLKELTTKNLLDPEDRCHGAGPRAEKQKHE